MIPDSSIQKYLLMVSQIDLDNCPNLISNEMQPDVVFLCPVVPSLDKSLYVRTERFALYLHHWPLYRSVDESKNGML